MNVYRPKLTLDEHESLSNLARDLDFFVDQPGRHFGNPSPGQMLVDLAATYAANPTAVANALRSLGISGTGPPPERE